MFMLDCSGGSFILSGEQMKEEQHQYACIPRDSSVVLVVDTKSIGQIVNNHPSPQAAITVCDIEKKLRNDFMFFHTANASNVGQLEMSFDDDLQLYVLPTDDSYFSSLSCSLVTPEVSTCSSRYAASNSNTGKSLCQITPTNKNGKSVDVSGVSVGIFPHFGAANMPTLNHEGVGYVFRSLNAQIVGSDAHMNTYQSTVLPQVNGSVLDYGGFFINSGVVPPFPYAFQQSQCLVSNDKEHGDAHVDSWRMSAGGAASTLLDTTTNPPVSPTDYHWISCGVLGQFNEYVKFKRVETAGNGTGVDQCQRDCLLLDATSDLISHEEQYNKYVDFESTPPKRFVFASNFLVERTDAQKLVSFRQFTSPNCEYCVGNSTNSHIKTCYRSLFGGGNALTISKAIWSANNDTDGDNSTAAKAPAMIVNVVTEHIWEFCKLSLPSAAVVEFCVTDWTVCSDASIVSIPQCSTTSSSTSMYMLMYDSAGRGWNGAAYSVYKLPPASWSTMGLYYGSGASSASTSLLSSGWSVFDSQVSLATNTTHTVNSEGIELIGTGSLGEGKFTGAAPLCVSDGCYVSEVSLGVSPHTIAWILCGSGASQAGMSLVFQVWCNDKYRSIIAFWCRDVIVVIYT